MAREAFQAYTRSMRTLLVWLLAAAVVFPVLPATAGAPPDEGVSAAAAASTPDDAASQGEQAAQETEDQELEARLTAVQGPVYVHLADHADGDYAEAEPDMPIAAGDEIRVGTGGSAELTVEGNTVIQLAANSDFVVNSLAPSSTEFHLGLGSLVAKIKHLVEGRSMEFHTPTALAAVRGTELGVSQAEDSEARVGVFDEGNVSVRGAGGEGEVHLGPNQETQVAAGKPIEAARPMSWWEKGRGRINAARARQQEMLRTWRPRALAQRRAWRQRILQRRALKRAALKGLSPRQRRTQYRAQRARQQALRQQFRARRQQRQQDRSRMQQMRRQRQQRRLQKAQRRQHAEQPADRPRQRWQAQRAQPQSQPRRERRVARRRR